MPSFLHPTLFWLLGVPTLAVVAIPVLIHLINMMRHHRVHWAAMEFLLLSQKKHRTWVLLKQLLLLLLRMLAVAAVVLMVAQPRLRSQWNLLGGARTHHVVLLDDSFSMSDRWGDTDAFSEAKKVVQNIASNATRQNRLQSWTLLRLSRVGRPQRPTEPDLIREPVNTEFADKLEALVSKFKVTQLAPGPAPALQAMAQLLGDDDGEHRILYVISDFRTRQWADATDLRKELSQLSSSGTEIHLINCADRARPNLAIVSLAPTEGIRAAGVSLSMDVAVRNYGPTPARNVSVALGEDGHGRAGVSIAEIPPGKTASERFRVLFQNAGTHQITARLDGDAVSADNYRYCTLDLPPDVPLLLIDGEARPRDARFLNLALAPGESVRTGLRPQIEPPRYLSVKPLDPYRVVNLTNIERLESSSVAALENFAAAGGGVAFFLGERCDVKFFNDVLYKDGKGLFPVPLTHQAELLVDRLEPAPDLQPEPHFIFRSFSGKLNSFLQAVSVQRYFAVPEGWRPSNASTVRVVARLRNGAPLAVERSFGKGRVVAFLTTASPTWNNWAGNPSFVVTMLELQAYLSQPSADDKSRLVGSPLVLRLDPKIFGARDKQVRFTLPEDATTPLVPVTATPAADGLLTASLFDTDLAGFYEAQIAKADNTVETRRYAMNVDPQEGNLATVSGEQLAQQLTGVKYKYEQASQFQSSAEDWASYNLGEIILYALVLLLIGEQILAWSASYHPARRTEPHAQGDAA